MNAKRDQVVIFSDEPGWHGRQLRRRFASVGLSASFVSLSSCSLVLNAADSAQGALVDVPGMTLSRLKGAFVRGVAGGTLEEVISRLNILHALCALEIPVFNDGRAIERTVDKAMTSLLLRMRGVPTMDTWVTESVERARMIANHCIAAHGSVVVKPLFGSQGKGVQRIRTMDEFNALRPTNGVYYLQAYIRPEGDTYRDWRVFVIDGRAIAAMQRSSRHWVTNRAQGAKCEPFQPDRSLKALAVAAADALQVDYAGVDLMRDAAGNWLVSEVNGIPAWQGLQRACDIDVSAALIDAFVGKANLRVSDVALA